MQLDIATYKNNLPDISSINERLFALTKNSRYLLNSAFAKLSVGEYVSAEETLQRLSYSKLSQDERWYYNLLYSKIELLKTSYEKAFEYAKLAHQDNIDRPKHPSHSYYLSVATRCGHIEESLRDTLLFKKENPIVVDYIKEIPSVITDDDGNKSLTQEFRAFLTERQQATENWQRLYKEGVLGLYQIGNDEIEVDYVNLLSQVLSSIGGKIRVFSGNIEILKDEVDLLHQVSSITVDVLSLVILAHFDLLNLLDSYEFVYVGYSTFSLIQEYFINVFSSKKYKLIYDWINQSPNCIKCPDGPFVFEDKIKSIFPIHLLGSINIAQQKNVPLLYGDLVEAVLLRNSGIYEGTINLVSINSLVDAMEDKLYARKIRYQLMQCVSFVNFDADDIVHSIEINHGVTSSIIERFLTCSSHVNVISFAKVYYEALIQLKSINQVWAKSFALELIKNTGKVRKRVTYYETTIESVLQGKVSKSLPYVEKNIQGYKAIVKYTEVIIQIIHRLFQEDQEICEALKSIRDEMPETNWVVFFI